MIKRYQTEELRTHALAHVFAGCSVFFSMALLFGLNIAIYSMAYAPLIEVYQYLFKDKLELKLIDRLLDILEHFSGATLALLIIIISIFT